MSRGLLVAGLLALAAAAGVVAWRCGRSPAPPAPEAELAALEARRDALRAQLEQARAADPRLAAAPASDVLVGMPQAFTTTLVRQLIRSLLAQVEIRLHDLHVHKQDDVQLKALLSFSPGRYTVDVAVHEVRALLRPGEPQLEFKGERVELTLPVTLAEGQGRATIDFDWDSRGLGRVACDDFRVTQEVSGRVRPRTYTLAGAFALKVEDGFLVAQPDFPELALRIEVEPSRETWESVERLLDERSWRCEKALDAVDVPKLLRGLLARGFSVRVPRKLFRPVRLPAGFEQTLSFEGRTYELRAQPVDLRLDAGMLWYGAALDVQHLPDEPAGAAQ